MLKRPLILQLKPIIFFQKAPGTTKNQWFAIELLGFTTQRGWFKSSIEREKLP